LYYHPLNTIHAPVSNQEDHNSRQEVENNLKKILENLKKINVPTLDINYYHNGTPGA